MKQLVHKLQRALVATPFAAVLVAGALVLPMATPAMAQNGWNLNSGYQSSRGDNTPAQLDGDQGVFKTVSNVLLFVTGAVSVIMLIFGGIKYTTSNGDQNAVTSAKNTIMYAVVGIVVAIFAYAIVGFVINAFNGDGA